MRETQLQSEILAKYGRDPNIRIWRANTGVAKFGQRTVRFGLPGSADLSGLIRGGIRLEIECKAKGGVQGPRQKNFQKMIESLGGCYILAAKLDDVAVGLSPWLRRPFGKEFERGTGGTQWTEKQLKKLPAFTIYKAIRGLCIGLQMISADFNDLTDTVDTHHAAGRIETLTDELFARTKKE